MASGDVRILPKNFANATKNQSLQLGCTWLTSHTVLSRPKAGRLLRAQNRMALGARSHRWRWQWESRPTGQPGRSAYPASAQTSITMTFNKLLNKLFTTSSGWIFGYGPSIKHSVLYLYDLYSRFLIVGLTRRLFKMKKTQLRDVASSMAKKAAKSPVRLAGTILRKSCECGAGT